MRDQPPGVFDQFVTDPVKELLDAQVEDTKEHVSIELPAVAVLETLRQSKQMLEVLR